MINIIKIKPGYIRKWPYPYLSGLTISNDIECMNFEFFEEFMSFLNTKKNTFFGNGLDLEITSSIFHYSANKYNFSVFKDANYDSQFSEQATRLNEYIKSGWIDTIHAFGDFDNFGGFERAHAENVINHLHNINSKINVFTNHGGAENIQNVGIDAKYHCGDIKGHKAYHTDLWDEIGIKYVWTDSMVSHSLKQKKISFRNRLGNLRLLISKNNNNEYFDDTDKDIFKSIKLNDGHEVIGFKRFRGTGFNAPNLSSLGNQISQISWREFYQDSIGIILYQHFGILDRVNKKFSPSNSKDIIKRPEVFISPFRVLSKESSEGRLWIAGCARFLTYLNIRNNIKINYEENGKANIYTENITIDNESDFQGITLYIDPSNFKGLFFNDKKIFTFNNGPDETGNYSVTVPIKKHQNIW